MATAKRVIQIPFDLKMVDEKGNVTPHWLDFLVTSAQATDKLRLAAENMNTLTSTSTATEVINTLEEMRGYLQDIT